MRRLLIPAVAVAVLVTGAPSASAATPTASWTVLAAPPMPLKAQPQAISCFAADSCIVIGMTENTLTGRTVEHAALLNNGVWHKLSAVPSPSRDFERLSCVSASNCQAEMLGQLYAYDGTKWTPEPVAGPPPRGIWSDVTCTSQTFCLAVGYGRDQSYAARFDGASWRFRHLPHPPFSTALFTVSCATPAACTAVGAENVAHQSIRHVNRPVAFRYDGGSWRVSNPPVPANEAIVDQYGVSCPGAHTCLTAGEYERPNVNDVAIAQSWHRGHWRLTHVPVPTGTTGPSDATFLNDLSCMSALSCVAVGGGFSAETGGGGALIEVWNATSWRDRRGVLPTPAGALAGSGSLRRISCGSPTTCIGVGSYTRLADHQSIIYLAERRAVTP